MSSEAGTAPPGALVRATRIIDRFTEAVGKVVAWCVAPMIVGVTYEVFARYVFNAPTIWAYDIAYLMTGTMFMLGAAYTLMRGAHIRTDLFWDKFSDRTRGWIDTVAYVLFFYPGLALLFFTSLDDAFYSYQIDERADQTLWHPPLWPFKAVIPASAALLMIQGASDLMKSAYAARTGRSFAPRAGGVEI
jgi:TRAP-type mannitol/chloroaromatic compound transport system permease small subunit